MRIVGRSTDQIISGGFNVYPAEVEAEINAFAGVPHAGVAVNLEALMALTKSRLANFRIPKHWVVERELPRNAMGKVKKSIALAS